jgi:AraC-like DNA-binding protein
MERAQEPTVSMHVVRALVGAVERAGVQRQTFLREAGLDSARLDALEQRVARSEVHRLCELVMDMTGDPAIGLHWAERLTAHSFTPVSHLIAHGASLRQGFASLSQFSRLLSDEPSYELREDGDKVAVRCLSSADESPRMQRFLAEMTLASFFHILRAFSVDARAELVSFSYPAPSYRDEYARVFKGAERFEQPFTGIVFDGALLSVASPHDDPGVHEALRGLAERRMSRLTQNESFAQRVKQFLVEHDWPQRVAMEAAARALGLSARTLRRRLLAEGRSYQEVENDALASVAKRLLRDKQHTIQETAHQMGFSDTTAFHRAFKRWTGTTPSAYLQGDRCA